MSTARTVIGLRTSCPSKSLQVSDPNDHSSPAASFRVTVTEYVAVAPGCTTRSLRSTLTLKPDGASTVG